MEIHRTASLHPSYLSYNSIRYLLENLARRNVRVDCFIYPLENNPPEKPFILAVREHYPHARLIGFQHTAWLKEQLGMFLLPEELPYHPLPGANSSAAAVAISTFSNRPGFRLISSCRDRTFATRMSTGLQGQAPQRRTAHRERCSSF